MCSLQNSSADFLKPAPPETIEYCQLWFLFEMLFEVDFLYFNFLKVIQIGSVAIQFWWVPFVCGDKWLHQADDEHRQAVYHEIYGTEKWNDITTAVFEDDVQACKQDKNWNDFKCQEKHKARCWFQWIDIHNRNCFCC